MRTLFVMDPLDRINVKGDSTYMLMREGTDRGHAHWMCTPSDLHVEDGAPTARCVPVTTHREAPHFRTGPAESRVLDEFDVVWMRKDPPFDMTYVFTTWVLDMAKPPTIVLNDPLGLKRFNEKLWAMHFARFQPRTLLARDMAQIRAWIEALPSDKAVLKPWNGNGGRGVIVTGRADRNLGSLLEMFTDEGREWLIVQEYVPGISKGDKRILLFDGEPVAGVLRVPSDRDHRGNMHVGATAAASELSEREREICDALGPDLREHGLLFVGIDVIDGRLTEINVTSPTGIQEANRLYGLTLERDLVDRVEARVRRARENAA